LAEDNEDDVLMIREAFDEASFGSIIGRRFRRRAGPPVPAARAALRSRRLPGLLMLDINMPRKDGFEVLEEVKADAKLRHLPLIMMTTSHRRRRTSCAATAAARALYVTKTDRFQGVSRPRGRHLGLLTGAALPACRSRSEMAVRCERPPEHPHVAIVTLDRPDKANSLDLAMLRRLAETWRTLAADDDVRCVVLTGAGNRVFCGGMDMTSTIPVSQRMARGERIADEDFEALRNVQTALLAGFDLGKPLVCAINGHARAGGFDMMLAAEIRLAVPDATFALEEVALGLYPTGNTTVLLPRQIPWVHAHELMLTAKPIDAERALQIGPDQPHRCARVPDGRRGGNRRRDRGQRAARGAHDARGRARADPPAARAAYERQEELGRRSARAKTRAKRSVRSSRSANPSSKDASGKAPPAESDGSRRVP
jgi:enoyl-CoA hydratase/carnithine racemase